MATGIISGTAEHGVCTRLTARVFSRAAEHGIGSGFGYSSFRLTDPCRPSTRPLHGLTRRSAIISAANFAQNIRIFFLELFKVHIKILDLDSTHGWPPIYGLTKDICRQFNHEYRQESTQSAAKDNSVNTTYFCPTTTLVMKFAPQSLDMPRPF